MTQMAVGITTLSELFGVLALAIVLIVGGYLAVMAVKRWTRGVETYQVFTLQDLRDMQARGEITATEYAKMRAAMLGKYAEEASGVEAPDEREEQTGGSSPSGGKTE